MNKLVLIPIIIGAGLLTAGAVILGVGLATAKTAEQITSPYEFSEKITNFDFVLSTADLEFKVSEDSSKKVIVEETEKEKHTVTLESGTLKIVHNKDPKKWFEYIGWNTAKIKVSVYLPAGTYGDLNHKGATGDMVVPESFAFNNVNLKLSTGDVTFKANVADDFKCEVSTGLVGLANMKAKTMNLIASTGNHTLMNVEVTNDINSEQSTGKFTLVNSKCNNLNVKTSTGDQIYENVNVNENITLKASTGQITLNKVNCKNYESKSNTGDVEFKETLVAEHLKVETSTGDVKFYNSDAATLEITTDTGDIKGNLLNEHIFYVEHDTGSPKYPHCENGGKCEIKTDTGKIDITVGAK